MNNQLLDSGNELKVINAITGLAERRVAEKHHIPPIRSVEDVPRGRLHNGVAADFKISLAGARNVFIRMITRFDSRPKNETRRKIIREQMSKGILARVLFVFKNESVNSIRRKVADLIRSCLATIESKWVRHRNRMLRHCSFVARDMGKYPCQFSYSR